MIRRSRPPAKPAPTAGTTLYTGAGLWDAWVGLLLAEKAVDDSRHVAFGTGRPDEDFVLLNPEQRLPALVERDLLVTGERVIAEYLDERYPHPRLLPNDPAQRARVRMALERFQVEIFPPLKAAIAGRAGSAAREQLARLVAETGSYFPPRGFFTGAEYTQADVAWAVFFKGALKLQLKLPEASLAYVERLAKRKAVLAYFKQ